MTNRCCKYILNAPYPSVPLLQPDPNAVRLLLNDYAGVNGELTAVTQYFYNEHISAKQNQMEASEVFACVSMTEMHHLDLLGELIVAYGGDPVFLSYAHGTNGLWWNGGMLNYNKSMLQILRDAFNAEKTAIKNYRQRISQLHNPAVTELLERIILDETHHAELFQELLTKVPVPRR